MTPSRRLHLSTLPSPLPGEGRPSPEAPAVIAGAVTLTADADAELEPSGTARVVSVVTRDGVSDDCDSRPIDTAGTCRRISRLGSAFAMHPSTDARRWSRVRYFSMGAAAPEEPNIGIPAQSPSGEGTTAAFMYVSFNRVALTEVRDGS